MDANIRIIEALANGVNPLTGEVLPPESLYNSPEVIRAFFAILRQLKTPASKIKRTLPEKRAYNLERGLPENAGLPWTEEQKLSVAEQFKSGKQVNVLASEFGRTRGAIIAELKKQGLIED